MANGLAIKYSYRLHYCKHLQSISNEETQMKHLKIPNY